MKLKSTNIYYLLGLIPLTVLDFTLGMVLAKSHLWLVIALGALCVLSVYAIIKKFIWVPHSEKSYGNLKSVEFSLPVDYEVDLYESEKMACYDFLVRVAELISPLSFHGERPKLVINPNLRAQYGDAFMQIAAVRELRRYEKKGALRTLLRLVMPVELLLALVLSVFAFQVDLTQYFSFFVLNFLLPFLLVVVFVGDLYLWNRSISKQDTELDCFLKSCFAVQDIEKYIQIIEKLEGGNEQERSKKFSEHYAQERINALRKAKR